MPRASDGSYSLPPGTLVSTGDTVLVSQHNPAMGDIAASLTNSLDRDGKGGMRASLPMGGNRITGLAEGTADDDAVTVAQLSNVSGAPVGAIFDYAGSTPPSGYFLCYGQAISRSTYAALFAVVGTTFGSGDGSTTFNLPDLRGRVAAGKDDMGGTAAGRLTTAGSAVDGTSIGSAGGTQSVTLSSSQMPSHTHAGTTDTTTTAQTAGSAPFQIGGGALPVVSSVGHSHSFTTNAAGGDEAHNNVQPTMVFNKIIRAS